VVVDVSNSPSFEDAAVHSTSTQGTQRSAWGRRWPARALLRRRIERAHSRSRRRRATWRDDVRCLALAIQDHDSRAGQQWRPARRRVGELRDDAELNEYERGVKKPAARCERELYDERN